MTKAPKGTVRQGTQVKTIKPTAARPVAGPHAPITKSHTRGRILKKTGGGSSYG